MAGDPRWKKTQDQNRAFGKTFEDILQRQARSNGLLAIHNGLTARFIGPGQIKAVKSDLDFRLIMKGAVSRVAWVDCKCFQDAFFDYSSLTEHQIERARLYADWGIPSGFVCWLRGAPAEQQVVFFSARTVLQAGPGTRFQATDGQCLGSISRFDLRAVFAE